MKKRKRKYKKTQKRRITKKGYAYKGFDPLAGREYIIERGA